jgi:hypothetical protein
VLFGPARPQIEALFRQMPMEFKSTKHQVARGSRADANDFEKLVLVKRVSELRATYQIRLLTYMAVREKKKLVIVVPENCKIRDNLRALQDEYPSSLSILRK